MTATSHLARAAAALLLLPALAAAQGTVSTQGLGFPPGQLSTRAASTGGALAEFDPTTPLNPASLDPGRSALFAQYEPEFRRVEAGDRTVRTTTSRFPLVGASLRVGDRGAIALTASTLLDRSWRTTHDTTRLIDGEEVETRESYQSIGSITDLRLGGSWALTRKVHVGAGLHGFTGNNRLRVNGRFGDSTTLTLQDDAVSFGGAGLSAGASVRLSSTLDLAASARKGGTIKARRGGDIIASAHAPDRVGVGLLFDGITGTTLAANLGWTAWSNLNGLVSSRVKTSDAWDMGVGADVTGPRFASRIIMMRGGLRWRTLPFAVGEDEVSELGLSLGAGVPLARDRASFDVGVLHARRSAGDARENAWTLSVGFAVRP